MGVVHVQGNRREHSMDIWVYAEWGMGMRYRYMGMEYGE